MDIAIEPAAKDEIPAIVRFVMAARVDMFPMLDPTVPLPDLANFQQTYMDSPNGCFLTAHADGQLIATIGYVSYDHRFPHLKLGEERIVEVLRLWVDPAWRRVGLASRLVRELLRRGEEAGVELFYLHTHPFLPGAVQFWEKQGFEVLDIEEDPVWHTTHMSRLSTSPESETR